MVTLELYGANDDEFFYLYSPEGKRVPGSIAINIDTGKTRIMDLAIEDEFKIYARQACYFLESCWEKDLLDESMVHLWY